MIDNMPYHILAWQEFCKRHSIELTDELDRKITGRKNNQIFEILFNQNRCPLRGQRSWVGHVAILPHVIIPS